MPSLTWDELFNPTNKQRFETTLTLLTITTPLATLIYLSLKGHVIGVDGWYWVQIAYRNQAWIGNVFATGMYLSPFILLTFINDNKHKPYFIAALMALNLFTVKTLVPELDDYLILLAGYTAVTYAANLNHENKVLRHATHPVTVGLLFAATYAAMWGWLPFQKLFAEQTQLVAYHAEQVASYRNFFGYLPIVLLLGWNKKWKPLLLVTTLYIMYPFPKFAVTAMLPLIYALHTEFLKDKDFTYPQLLIGLLLLAPVIALPVRGVHTVQANEAAFDQYCNTETRICNPPPQSWDKGHYFAHMGYMTDQPFEYGQCLCRGQECIEGIITCGDHEYPPPNR